MDLLSVTFDTIDVAATVAKGWEPGDLGWRSDVAPELVSVRGHVLRSVSTIEVAFPATAEGWCLQLGVGATPGLAIFNGLDDTRVSLDLAPVDGWRTRGWLAT